MDTTLQRSPQRDGHVQGPDRKFAPYSVADGPVNDARGMLIEDGSKVEPAFPSQDIANVTCPSPIGGIRMEAPV